MRKLISIFTLLVIGNVCFSQEELFSYRVDNYGTWETSGNILSLDSCYVIGGGVGDSITLNRRISFIKFDLQGNIVWKKNFGNENKNLYHGFSSLISYKNGYVMAGTYQDTTGNNDAVIYYLNSNFDSTGIYPIGSPNKFETFFQCRKTSDNGLIAIGQSDSTDADYDILLVKLDSTGNIEWKKYYGGNDTEIGYTVDTCTDGGYILGGYTKSYGSGYYDTYIVKTDSLGNFEWQRVFGGSEFDCIGNVRQTSTGEIIVSTCKSEYTISSLFYGRARFIKLDMNGNTIWDNLYGPVRRVTELYQCTELKDGSFIASGQTSDKTNDQTRGLIMKVAANGDSLLYRTYSIINGQYSKNYLRDIAPTNDGGYVAGGFVQPNSGDTGTQDMWILKVDSNGCLTPGCLTSIADFQDNAENVLTNYPNPFSSSTTIEVDMEEMFSGNLIVSDVTGKKLKEIPVTSNRFTYQLSASGMGAGIYFLRLFNKDGELVETGKMVVSD